MYRFCACFLWNSVQASLFVLLTGHSSSAVETHGTTILNACVTNGDGPSEAGEIMGGEIMRGKAGTKSVQCWERAGSMKELIFA